MNVRTAKENFFRITKRVLKENLSTNPSTLESYKVVSIKAFNTLSKALKTSYETSNLDRKTVTNTYLYAFNRIKSTLNKLSLQIDIPKTIFATIKEEHIRQSVPIKVETNKTIDISYLFNDNLNMAMTPIELIRLGASTINQTYNGDALHLQPFFNSINLLTPLANTEVLTDTLVNFI